MPYKSVKELPENVKDLPKHAKEIYLSAFNAAWEDHKDDEGAAHAIAWAAVKKQYKKNGDQWVAKESVQTLYNELIQEYSKHRASTRVDQVLESCREALDSGDESILDEARETLDWLRLQEVTRTEDGEQYPAAAYAYAPGDPADWKLCLWESPSGPTRAQLNKASAALSPGGFRGQRVDIPQDELPAVKRRIREEYRKLGVEDMPKWVSESESRELLHTFTPLSEATVGHKGVAKVVIIKPGWGNQVDNHYYPAETLSRDFAVFEGVKMYADHPTQDEEKQRPEGSIKQWVASLKNVRFEEGVGIVGDAVIIEPWLQQKLAALRDQNLLKEMGLSIRAAGVGIKGKIEGKVANIVERIVRARSVDFVTEAGAGGGVLLYEGSKDYDVDVVTLETLRERRPDLVKAVEAEVKRQVLQEVKRMQEVEERVKELETQVETLTGERDTAQSQLEEEQKARRIAEAKSVIDEALGKSELPEAARLRLVEKFKESESAEGIEEAIKVEKDYVDTLIETGKVKNLGGTKPEPQKDFEQLKQTFIEAGLTEEQAEIAARGR